MKKFLSVIIAAVFVVCSATTAKAATNLEGMLKDLSVPAEQAKSITDYVVANNISDATVDALVAKADDVLALIGDSSLSNLDADTKKAVIDTVIDAASSVGLSVKIDGAKVVLYKSNGESLVVLSTDVVEEIVTTTKEKLKTVPNLVLDFSKKYKEERTLYHNNRPKDETPLPNGNTTTGTTPPTLNQTGFIKLPFVAALAVMTLGASLVVVSRKINA